MRTRYYIVRFRLAVTRIHLMYLLITACVVLAYCDGLIFILEDKDVPVKIFDRSGRFVSSVGTLVKAPSEISSIYDFTIDPVNDRIYLFDFMRQEIQSYHYNGEYEESGNFIIPAKWDAAIRKIEWTNGGFLFYSETSRQTDKVRVFKRQN